MFPSFTEAYLLNLQVLKIQVFQNDNIRPCIELVTFAWGDNELITGVSNAIKGFVGIKSK
jgi:hypothetical protein